MFFLTPAAFAFLTLVPVIILLYLLKVKRRAVTVPALLFWQKIMQEHRRRSLFQQLRRILSLLLHLLIFVLILLALARPETRRFNAAGSSTVLVVDTRARMQALEPGGLSRIDIARRMLGSYAASAKGLDQAALIAADGSAEVRVPFSSDEDELRKGIAALRATDCGGSLDPALELAAQLLASRTGEKRIVVFSDRPVEWNGAGKECAVESVPVGTSRDNVSILQFAARTVPSSPDTSEVLLEIANFSGKPASGNADISLDGKLIDVMPFQLAPGGRKQAVFPSLPALGPGARGWLTARLEAADALLADNESFAALPSRDPSHVLLVTKGNWFIEKMLGADQQIRYELLAPDSFRADQAASFDAVILDDFIPTGLDLDHIDGNILFIKKTPFPAASEPLLNPLVTDTDTSSPLLRLVNLRNVTFLRASALDFQEAPGDWHFQSPLRSFDHPLVITGTRRLPAGKERRLAAFAFDVAESDLPLRIAFPLLMANTLQWLSGDPGFSAATGYRAGETIDPGPGGSLSAFPLRPGPEAPPPPVPVIRTPFRPGANGFYLLERNEKTSWIPVNTFSESESNLQLPSQSPASASESQSWFPSRLPILTRWPIWMNLTIAALSLFFLEWFLFHRRRTE